MAIRSLSLSASPSHQTQWPRKHQDLGYESPGTGNTTTMLFRLAFFERGSAQMPRTYTYYAYRGFIDTSG